MYKTLYHKINAFFHKKRFNYGGLQAFVGSGHIRLTVNGSLFVPPNWFTASKNTFFSIRSAAQGNKFIYIWVKIQPEHLCTGLQQKQATKTPGCIFRLPETDTIPWWKNQI